MNTDFDPIRAARDADLYRPDGRSFEIREESEVLTLELRRSVLWETSIISQWPFFLGVAILPLKWMPGHSSVTIMDWAPQILLVLMSIVQIVSSIRTGEAWKFDKNTAEVHHNQRRTHQMVQIRGVRAWRRRRKFYLALNLRYGQTLRLGRFAFSGSELSWRRDAAQIAEFLGVPLEIPPL